MGTDRDCVKSLGFWYPEPRLRIETNCTLQGCAFTNGNFEAEASLAVEDAPLMLRETSMGEIYILDWTDP